jgi:hypothetical protein
MTPSPMVPIHQDRLPHVNVNFTGFVGSGTTISKALAAVLELSSTLRSLAISATTKFWLS